MRAAGNQWRALIRVDNGSRAAPAILGLEGLEAFPAMEGGPIREDFIDRHNRAVHELNRVVARQVPVRSNRSTSSQPVARRFPLCPDLSSLRLSR